ncbi:MAG: hypothetical protein WBL38_02845, partial [Desulfomonilia bacterium]
DMMVRDPGDLFAAEEMAKWLEHRAYDHLRAIEIVETALSGSGTLSLADRSSLAHRLARLKRKAASAGRRPPE